MTVKRTFLLGVLVLTCAGVFPAERTSIWEGVEPKSGPLDLGILFSANDISLDLQGFQGGVGAKLNLKDWMLRGTADLLLNTRFDPFSISLGAVLEKHLWPGPLSVYWGPSAGMGFTTLLLYRTDDDNWSRTTTVPLSLGCVFGIEVFFFQFLSLFVEYQGALDLGLDITRVSTAGSVSTDTEFTYKLDVGMGNNAMFGIVFYLMKRKPETDVAGHEPESTQ
jgi:hypothetical protein